MVTEKQDFVVFLNARNDHGVITMVYFHGHIVFADDCYCCYCLLLLFVIVVMIGVIVVIVCCCNDHGFIILAWTYRVC